MNTIEASFSIWSKIVSPEEISKITAVRPDRTSRRGADRNPPRGLPVAHGWHLILREEGEVFLEQAFLKLMKRVEPMDRELSALRRIDPEISFRVAAILSPSPTEFSLYLGGDIVQRLAHIGVSVDVVFESADATLAQKESAY